MRSLMPSRPMRAGGELELRHRCIEEPAGPRRRCNRCDALDGERTLASVRSGRAHAPLGHDDLDDFCEPHRPGDDRGNGQPDQHRLHHRVGVEIHAPRAEIARQRRDADDRRACRLLRARGRRHREHHQRAAHRAGKMLGGVPADACCEAMTIVGSGHPWTCSHSKTQPSRQASGYRYNVTYSSRASHADLHDYRLVLRGARPSAAIANLTI